MPAFHILVIDDNPADLRLTVQAIAEAGFPCGITMATDGDLALNRLRSEEEHPDLILVDLNLPRNDGLTVIRELKRESKTRRIPVVVISNSAAPPDIESAYAALANCYIVKPLSFDAYASTIASLGKFWFGVAQLPSQPRRGAHEAH